jgi:pimeloyl-ACP methyl ester carboxylesterase
MTSQKSKFKFINRGFQDCLVLAPGWAFDYRIFSNLKLNYNYLLPLGLYPFDFGNTLLDKLSKLAIGKISLYGWSLGGFLAAEFALSNQKMINKLILVSVCERFNPQNLRNIELKLKPSPKAFLYKFYQQCFSDNDIQALSWFKENLLKQYLGNIKLNDLLGCLDYLKAVSIDTKALSALEKIKIFHGSQDKIVPLEEAVVLKTKIPQAEFICLEAAGHIPFLSPQFLTWTNKL